MNTLRTIVKCLLVAVAAMLLAAWYLSPSELTLEGTTQVEGTITKHAGRRLDQVRIDAGSRVYWTRCARAAALCKLATEVPGTRVQAHVLESPFRHDDWIVQAVAGGTFVLSLEQQRLLFEPLPRQLARNAAVAAVAAVAALVLLRNRGRTRRAAQR